MLRPAPVRVMRALAAFLLTGSAALLPACGGGGGGGSFAGDDFFQILAFYDFAITNPPGAPAPSTRSTTTAGQPTDDTYSIDAGTGTIRGRWDRASGNMTVADSTSYTVNWTEGGPTPTQFSIGFTGQGLVPGSLSPPMSSGSYAVTWGTDTITVSITSATVTMALNGGAPVTISNAGFFNLDRPGSVGDAWQRVAARAARALVELLGQARAVPSFLTRVNDGELDSGQSVTTCETIPGLPPAGVGQVGEIVAVELNGGDDYLTTGTDCFQELGSNGYGALWAGTVNRRNLVTTVDAGSLMGFGFEGSALKTGGVAYDTRLRYLTKDGMDVWSFDGNEIVDTGGFSVSFAYPNQ